MRTVTRIGEVMVGVWWVVVGVVVKLQIPEVERVDYTAEPGFGCGEVN